MDRRKRRDIGIYKANLKNSGSVAQFKLGNNDDCMFLECARQNAPADSSKPYDWDNKIIVKLGESDICKLMAYIKLHRPGAPLKLFHESPGGGNKTVEFKWQEYNGRPSYFLSVSHQKVKGEQSNRVSVPIGLDEVEYLQVAFRRALEIILAWD